MLCLEQFSQIWSSWRARGGSRQLATWGPTLFFCSAMEGMEPEQRDFVVTLRKQDPAGDFVGGLYKGEVAQPSYLIVASKNGVPTGVEQMSRRDWLHELFHDEVSRLSYLSVGISFVFDVSLQIVDCLCLS